MKNIYLLSNLTKTSVSRRIDSVSLPSRCRVMPIILLFLAAFSLHAWGASYTITFNGTDSESTSITTSTTAASITGSSSYVTGNVAAANKAYGATSDGIKLGAKSSVGSITINLSTSGQVTPTSIVANCKLYNSTKPATLSVNGATAKNVTADFDDLTFDITTAITSISLSSNKYIWVKSITVNYSGGSCTDPTTPLSITNEATATVGTPVALATAGGNGSAVTWSIVSGGSYATLSGSTLNPTAAGTVRVQASQGESGGECGATVTKDITISVAPIDVTLHYKGTSTTLNNQANPYTLPTTGAYVANACDAWTFDGWYGSSYAKSTTKPTSYITELTASGNAYAVYKHTEGGSAPETHNFSGTDDFTSSIAVATGVTISFAKGANSNNSPYWDGNAVRVYYKNTMTVTSTGDNLTRIEFTQTSGTNTISANIGSMSGLVWTGNASSVTFTLGGSSDHRKITSISIGGGGTTYYSTDAECGPKVQATSSPWVTSTQGATVKVEVPVTATNFDASCTLSASVSGSGFSIVGWGANGNSITAGEDLTTSLILEYSPTVSNSEATITFNSTYGGSLTPVYTAGTVHGRSLPGLFVIAIKNGGTWYALPADMSGSGTYAGVAVDVDDIDNPTKVMAGPATALYRLMGVHSDRYGNYGTRVRFVSEYNSKCLWSNQADGGTGINNGAMASSANSDNYEWTLVTTDGITYAINTNVAKKIEEGRELRYFAGESRFGMYTSGNSSFRLLPVDCWTRATVTNVSSTYNSVTLTWAGKSGTEYNVYIDEGGVTKKTENNVSSPVTISGLDSETNYTWIISPGAKDNGCALSGAFATNVAPIDVTLSCDGTEHALGAQDKPYTLPTTGPYVANACTEWEFVGWTASPYSKSTSAPTLITEMNADGTAYAVYTHTEGGGSTAYTLTIGTSDFSSDGYAGTLNDIDAVDDSDNTNTLGVSFNKSNAGKVGSYIQFKENGYIYNTTDLGSISSITTNSANVGYYINSTANPSSAGSGGYFKVYGILSTATDNKTNNIEIHFTKGSGTTYYATTSECCNEVAPPTVSVDAVDMSATISWNDQIGAVNGYNVTCTNGTNQDVAAGVTSLEITGLSPLENYEYTVTAKGATCNRSYTGTFTTASCSVVPTGVSVTPSTSSVIVRWVHASPKATVTIYSDNTCSDVVKTEDNLTTGCTVSGLEEGKTYFLKVFAGAGCGSSAVEFTTLSSAVIIAEWFTDSIRINLTADTATATVLIEDKKNTSTASTSYADGLFFSKYYEAYRNIKLWAVYNGTEAKISLANITVKSSNNGSDWGKDSGGSVDNKKITSLASYGHHEAGYIYPGEEIIVYSNGSDTQDADIITCMESAYGEAYKTDPDSIWYLVKNSTTSISGDDGLLLLDGTDTLDVIGGTNANTAYIAANSKPTWGDAVGWNCDDGEDVNGNTLALSTNRCLLVRKNTVKNGLNAVAKNKNYFNTLCDEWWGAHVPETSDEVQTSCDNFAYVGHYDYNNYYAKFDTVTTVDELGGKQNDDGTYTIPIPQLDTLSCTMLRVNVYEGSELKTSAEYKVPIMVEGNKTTQDTIFVSDYPTQTRTAETCKECDVVILKGATLTKAEHTGNDVDLIRNLTIYPGGTMDIPNSRTFNVASVQFRVEGENVPFIKLSGMLHTSDQQVLVSRRINNSDAYFFSLPYDCNISDIRWSNGEPAVLDNGFRIKEYDSRARADEGSTKGAPGHWKMVTGSTLEAGKGYQISVNSKYLKELIFPLDLGKTNVSDAENEKVGKSDNVVPIHQYTNGATTINNHNWNFIAQPYLCAMTPMAGDAITYGYLDWKVENDEVVWERKEVDNQYLTIYDPSSKTYTQKSWTAVSQLDPFLAFFVQGKAEGTFTFVEGNRLNNAPARHLASQAEVDEDPSIFVGVTLSGNGLTDQANLRVRQDFTEEEYKLGYDLLKFTTYYKDRPQVYMKTPSYQLAFQAVNDSVAKNTFLPMGVYCYKPGTYTFGLSNDYPIDEVEAVYLYDKVSGVTTNLLYDTYTITTNSQLYTNTRFALNVIVNRRAPQVTTDIGIPEAPDNMVRKILINGHVYIQRGAAIYDITGKQMLNF
ncbi:MAG: fibronectin type III domain-containing protein [Paludibacteraceae bacterium]|nr:fibronectin type III domain-containing protein [Paludibacteraceae bacterium]